MADFGTLFANAGKGNVKKAQKSGNDRITYLHYSKLVENPHQYRKFSQQDVEEMADLIAAAGKVLQPLLVRKTDADEYEIIAGHKRRAGVRFLVEERKLEKYSLIPCIVSTADDIQARFSVVGTNVRPVQTPFETLHEIEEMRELLTQYPEAFPDLKGGRMVERLAGQLHMARSTVSEYRKIANNLGEAGMEALKEGLLEKSAALELASLPEDEQDELLKNGILKYTEIREYRKKKLKGTEAAGVEADKPLEDSKADRGEEDDGNIPVAGNEPVSSLEVSGKCAHREGYKCTLPEEAKQTAGDGTDCHKKCCWECTREGECKTRCNAAESNQEHPGECMIPHEQPKEKICKNDNEDRCETVRERTEGGEQLSELGEVVQNRYEDLLKDMPQFRIEDIKEYSQKLEKELREYQEAEAANGKPMPEMLMARQRMRVAGLRLLMKLETDRLTN